VSPGTEVLPTNGSKEALFTLPVALVDRSDRPLVLIPDRNLEKDYLTGYLDALQGISSRLVLKKGRAPKNSVVLAGYLFDRNEGDHRGNVQELVRMLRGIGARVNAVLLDGTPFAKLKKLTRPGLVIDLAGGWRGAADLAETCSAGCLAAGLPVGIEGTSRWIRMVGSALGLEEPAEAFIRREVSGLARMLEWILPRFFTGKSAIAILSLGLEYGKTLRIHARGEDASDAVAALAGLVRNRFQED